jgi:hypothetical protein
MTGIVGCCARAASGQLAKLLPRNAMSSRRLMGAYPKAKDYELIIAPCIAAKRGHSCPRWVKLRRTHIEHMSAGLPPIADIAWRGWHGTKVPKAVVSRCSKHRYSIASSTLASNCGGTSSPSALAVCILMTNSNFVDCTTGKSAGFAPLRI